MTWHLWHSARLKLTPKIREAISQKTNLRYNYLLLEKNMNHMIITFSTCTCDWIIHNKYLDPESMLNNENAKGKSDLVFIRGNAVSNNNYLDLLLIVISLTAI